MSVSMGALRDAMGASGAIAISKLFRNGYTRTFGADGIRKINCFQVEAGNAPNPATEGSANHSLGEFAGYNHTLISAGASLDAVVGNGQVDVSWALPAGYTRDPGNNTQLLFTKDLGTAYDSGSEGDPFTGGSSQDVGDGTSKSVSGLTGAHFYAIGVKTRRNDSVANADAAVGHAADGSLNTRVFSDIFNSGNSIVVGPIFSPEPVLTSAVHSDPETCAVEECDSTVVLSFDGDNGGPTGIWVDEQVDSGGWTTILTNIPSTTNTEIFLNRCDNSFYEYRARYGSGGTNGNIVNVTIQCEGGGG